jgi:PIN domain
VVRRKWVDEVRTPLAKLKLGEFGLAESQQEMTAVIDAAIDGYADALRARLAEIGVEVVGVPDSVDWLDVVQRASDRRPPYSQGQKDGFRDTLIWHSTREVSPL